MEIVKTTVIKKETEEKIKKEVSNIEELGKTIEKYERENTTLLVDIILVGAIALQASDIHLEPEEKKAQLRIRIDGILHNVFEFELKQYQSIVSRIKLLSLLKLNIRDRAQDGRFTIVLADKKIEIRVSSLPSEYGESIVLRILNPDSLIGIDKLGIRKDVAAVFEKQIHQPNGMIIVTGPTGSGKTTTLYAILKKLQSPEVKIITIEDPIEYHLEGISQTQVNPKRGYDFANGLRAIVRQDPDIILVGEIRDLETAKIAIQAAMTGHLVLTTLHTNDSVGAVARLQALGEKAINIGPALNIVIGQRLVRKVCQKCATYSRATEEEIKTLKKELSFVEKTKKIKIDKNIKIAHPKGCSYCNFTGYKGRVGIFEFFVVDEEMENLIAKSPTIPEIKERARKKGMITMREDGFINVLEGKTTIDEVNRVTKEE